MVINNKEKCCMSESHCLSIDIARMYTLLPGWGIIKVEKQSNKNKKGTG